MLNDLSLVKTDSYGILNELVKYFEESYGEILYPGDERRIFLHNLSQVIIGMQNTMNTNFKYNFLRYAKEDKLDGIGELMDTERLPALHSKTRIKFSLSAVQTEPVTINKGTKVTPDGQLYFITTEDLIIEAGENFGEVEAQSIESGERFNGLLPGQIKNLVDPIPYVQTALNTIKSYGGADIEDDDKYRERIRLATHSFSVAGPEGAYEYHAKSVDNSINSVKVISPSPGIVRLIILLNNGQIPGEAMINKVLDYISGSKIRPLTDKVEVVAPEVINYDIDFTYYILQEHMTDEAIIKEKVSKAVDEYILYQKSSLGRDINPDFLRKLVLNAGANRIVLKSPSYLKVEDFKVANVNLINVTYGGLE